MIQTLLISMSTESNVLYQPYVWWRRRQVFHFARQRWSWISHRISQEHFNCALHVIHANCTALLLHLSVTLARRLHSPLALPVTKGYTSVIASASTLHFKNVQKHHFCSNATTPRLLW